MTVNDFQNGCPKNAHICSINMKGANHCVMSAKGHDVVDGKPGLKAIVWNRFGKAYSRVRTQKTKNWTKGIYFQGYTYERDEDFDLKVVGNESRSI